MNESHNWGDSWPFWNDLDKCIDFVWWFSTKIGRFGGQTKEKFGSLRFYVMFHYQLHDLFYPGHYYIRWGKFGQFLDSIYTKPFFNPIRRLICVYQEQIYKLIYWIAVRRWPHIMDEIVNSCDYDELLPKELGVYVRQFRIYPSEPSSAKDKCSE